MYVFGGWQNYNEYGPIEEWLPYQVRFISGCEIFWLRDYFIDSKEFSRLAKLTTVN